MGELVSTTATESPKLTEPDSEIAVSPPYASRGSLLILYSRLFRPKPGQWLRPPTYPQSHLTSSSATVTETQDPSVPKSDEGTESLDAIGAHHDKRGDPLVGGSEQPTHSNTDEQEGTLPLGPRFYAKAAGSYSPSNTQGSVGHFSLIFPRDCE